MSAVERRLGWWLEVVSDLLARPSITFPRKLLASELASTFGTQVSWNWMDASGDIGFDLHTPIPNWPTGDVVSNMVTAIGHHPLITWFAASGDPGPMSVGRVPDAIVTALGRRIVNEYLVPIDMGQQLSIPYRLGHNEHRAFVLARGGDDFSDEDLRVAMRIQTLLLVVDRQCAASQRFAQRPPDMLTGQELAVLGLLADGLTAAAIAHRLSISPRTVHRHLQNLYRKLGVSDRLRAVMVARASGLLCEVDPSPEPEISGDVTVRVQAGQVGIPDINLDPFPLLACLPRRAEECQQPSAS